MKHPQFYLLLGSRLGLKNYPIGSNEHNIGVENGSNVIFTQLIKSKNEFRKDFIKPEKITENFLKRLFEEYNKVINEVKKIWPQNTSLITLGGDHSISYISLNAVLERYGKDNTGVIFFDSHADLHLSETSPSGNFHGMWMRTFFDQFEQTKLESQKLTGDQVLYIGNLQTESEENRFISEKNIINIDQNKLDKADSIINNFTKKFKHIHITFDIDVFNRSIVSATGTPNPNGLEEKIVLELFEQLLINESISIDIVEYNPSKDTDQKTLHVIKKIVERIQTTKNIPNILETM